MSGKILPISVFVLILILPSSVVSSIKPATGQSADQPKIQANKRYWTDTLHVHYVVSNQGSVDATNLHVLVTWVAENGGTWGDSDYGHVTLAAGDTIDREVWLNQPPKGCTWLYDTIKIWADNVSQLEGSTNWYKRHCAGPLINISTPTYLRTQIWIDNRGPWINLVPNYNAGTDGYHFVGMNIYDLQWHYERSWTGWVYTEDCRPYTMKWG